MIRVLCWKELREHRIVWLTVAVLGALMIVTPSLLFVRGGLLFIASDEPLARTMATASALVLAVTYGLVCGAMMLAGEREAGTQVFLDTLSGSRAPLLRVKLAVGLGLAATQALFLMALDRMTGIERHGIAAWEWVGINVLLALTAFAAALYASSLCGNALTAVGLGLGFWFGGWAVAILCTAFVEAAPPFVLGLLSLAAVYASQRIYCRVDRRRLAAAEAAGTPAVVVVPSWRVLGWLALRQGRLLLVVLALACLALGFVPTAALVRAWPIAGLLIGTLCGLFTFASDQDDFAYRLLGSQRVPPGRFWAAKIVCWVLLACALGFLVWLGFVVRLAVQNLFHPENAHRASDMPPQATAVFWLLWPLYSFAVAQLCAVLCRKTLLALPLSLLLGAILSGLWLPSLLFGGLALWSVLGVPVLLLTATRLVTWAWFGDRLFARRPVLTVVACGALALAWLGGMLWYRVLEVPDVGEPFDMSAFRASLPPLEKNESGRLIRAAAEAMSRDLSVAREVENRLPSVIAVGWPGAAEQPGAGGPGEAAAGPGPLSGKPTEELSRWLDKTFEQPWIKDFQTAARSPPGMVIDPRTAGAQSESQLVSKLAALRYLFAARALQVQANGDDAAALENLLTGLALSRQIRNFAIGPLQLKSSYACEEFALVAYEHWLEKVGPKQELLRRALDELGRHESETPSLAGVLKSNYLATQGERSITVPTMSRSGPFERKLFLLSEQVPWERERLERVRTAVCKAQVHLAELLDRDQMAEEKWWVRQEGHQAPDQYWAMYAGMYYLEGPGSELSLAAWGRILEDSAVAWWGFPTAFVAPDLSLRAAKSRALVRGVRLQTALTLYQARHKTLPDSLNALVPKEIDRLPSDPFGGGNFRYEVSKGGLIAERSFGMFFYRAESFLVPAGQGVVWSHGPPEQNTFLVPRWAE